MKYSNFSFETVLNKMAHLLYLNLNIVFVFYPKHYTDIFDGLSNEKIFSLKFSYKVSAFVNNFLLNITIISCFVSITLYCNLFHVTDIDCLGDFC